MVAEMCQSVCTTQTNNQAERIKTGKERGESGDDRAERRAAEGHG